MKRQGILFVISGPSGVGKNSCLDGVFEQVDNLFFSVSVTTRKPREGEVDGVSYHFISRERFDEMVANDELLEYVNKYANCYGTLKDEVVKMMNEGKDVVLDIETVGAANVKRLIPEAVTVFIAPPSITELQRRLEKRGTETNENRTLRMSQSIHEMEQAYGYDYLVVNDNLESCVSTVVGIMRGERCKLKYNKAVVADIIEKR